jgi:hypothetical protein
MTGVKSRFPEGRALPAVDAAAGHPAVGAIMDRLHVVPAAVMGDGGIRAHLRRLFTAEPALGSLESRETKSSAWTVAPAFERVPTPVPDQCGQIDIEIHDGVVILGGSVSDRVS